MDVFLSYAHEDKETALRLADDLKLSGVDVWVDSRRLQPGENWVEALLDAIKAAPNFLALVSKNTAGSSHFSTELAAALAATEASGSSRRILPVIIDKEARLPPFLGQFHALDASTPERYDASVRELAKLVKQRVPGPLPDPEMLKQYEAVMPGMAERLLKMAEMEQLHRLELERYIRQDYLKGQLLAVLTLSLLMAMAIVSYVVAGSSTIFLATLFTALVGVLSLFVRGFGQSDPSKLARRPSNNSGTAHGD